LSERAARWWLVAFLSLAPAGCACLRLLHPPARLPPCPAPPRPTRFQPAISFGDRKHRGGEVDVGFALVAEKRAGRLVLVARNSFGAHVFQ
jgi:hypothetical protein